MPGFLNRFFKQPPKSVFAQKTEQVEARLRDEPNPDRRAALRRELEDLTAEKHFDEAVASAGALGPAIAQARTELQALNDMLAGEPDGATCTQTFIAIAIHHGAPIYNAGSHIGCAVIYDLTARLILRKLEAATLNPRASLAGISKRLLAVDFSPITATVAMQRAWALRHAFDEIMESFSTTAAPNVPATPVTSGTMTNPKAVFVSHAAGDRGMAEQLVQALEATEIRCWIAPRDIRFGANYAEEIMNAIKSTDIMLVLLSKESNASQFVANEVERGMSLGKRIVPVRLENVQPSAALELFISARQWIDFWDGAPNREHNLQRLVGALRN